jgi:hypothetical protein
MILKFFVSFSFHVGKFPDLDESFSLSFPQLLRYRSRSCQDKASLDGDFFLSPPLVGISFFPSLDGRLSHSFPSLDGRGLRGGCNKQFIRTTSLSACNAQAGNTSMRIG